MSQVLSVTIDDWIYNEIEKRRAEIGATNRSEYVQEIIIRGMGLMGGSQ